MVWFEKPKVVPDVSSVHLFGGARCGSPTRLANLSKDQFPPPLKSDALRESLSQDEVFSRIPQATSPRVPSPHPRTDQPRRCGRCRELPAFPGAAPPARLLKGAFLVVLFCGQKVAYAIFF